MHDLGALAKMRARHTPLLDEGRQALQQHGDDRGVEVRADRRRLQVHLVLHTHRRLLRSLGLRFRGLTRSRSVRESARGTSARDQRNGTSRFPFGTQGTELLAYLLGIIRTRTGLWRLERWRRRSLLARRLLHFVHCGRESNDRNQLSAMRSECPCARAARHGQQLCLGVSVVASAASAARTVRRGRRYKSEFGVGCITSKQTTSPGARFSARQGRNVEERCR